MPKAPEAVQDDAPAPAAPSEEQPEGQPAASPAAASAPSPARAFYERNKAAAWAVGLGLPVLVVAVGWAVRPDIFYDQFLWAHLFGSAVADATQTGHACYHAVCVSDDYTLVAEAVYGAILAVSLYGIYVHVIKRFAVKVDAWWVAAVIPFILYGPVTRTLEDTSLFCKAGTYCEPGVFSYFFISPLLYAQIAVLVLVFMVAGALLDRSTVLATTKLALMGGLLGTTFAGYGLIWATNAAEFQRLAPPLVVLVSCVLGFGLFAVLQRRGANAVNASLAAGGVAFLLPPLWLIASWLQGDRWASTIGGLHLDAAPHILGLPFLTVLLVAGLGLAGRKFDPRLAAYAVPLNLGIVYGHMLDGFASFIAICSSAAGTCTGAMIFGLDLPSYGEKHPVSNALLGLGNGWVFPVIKLTLVMVIIWVLDVEYKKDLEKDQNLGGLVKMAILVLGLAPGLRDFLRLIMGT